MEHLEENGKPCLYLVRGANGRRQKRLPGPPLPAQNWEYGCSPGAAPPPPPPPPPRPHHQVFEFLSTDLKKYMDRLGKGPAHPLDPMLVKSFMYQLLKGVAHMHKHGVMHRDLKPQNLLVDDTTAHPLLKVADLGLGRHFSIPIKAYTHEASSSGRGGGGAGQARGRGEAGGARRWRWLRPWRRPARRGSQPPASRPSLGSVRP